MPVHAITWEDPSIEKLALKEILRFPTSNPDILVLASSGDTALILLNEDRVKSITCVSASSRQLAVLELKVQVMRNIPSPHDRWNFLNGNLKTEKVYQIYRYFRRHLSCRQYWDENFKEIDRGIFHFDAWSELFQELKANQFDCRRTFTYRRMRRLLGYSVISNSLTTPYHQYFVKTLEHQLSPNSPNCFYSRVYASRSSFTRVEQYPEYLSLPPPKQTSKLKYIHRDLANYLLNTSRMFDLITVGNFQDCLNEIQLELFLQLLQKKIRHRGRLVIRSLNNDYDLRWMLNKYFIILDIDRDLTDRTYLYSEVLLATPRGTRED